ncbi:MAG: ABC transporter permease [Candidatus Cryptobacteroides sp.]
MGALKSLIIKEIRQLRRNAFMPKLIVAYPLVIVLVMPWITTMDVRDINVAVVDCDRSDISARIASCVDASDYLSLEGIYPDYSSALKAVEEGHIDAFMEIPRGFGESLAAMPKKLNISANGVNAVKGSLGAQYLLQTVSHFLKSYRSETGCPLPGESVVVTNMYNPEMDYKLYMIPALLIMVLVVIGGVLPALNLVTEKENGRIEQINVSPVSKMAFTLSKLIPYWVICSFELVVCMLLARFVYGLHFMGSAWAVILAAVPFIMVMSALGVSIANISDTMQQTMFLMIFFILSFILMSGMMTPVESMPEWARKITYLLPPSYMVRIMRAVYLKGATMADLWTDYAALGGFAVLFCTIATLSYRKRG